MKLNFGCGLDIKEDTDWINADIQIGPGIDTTFDFDEFPYPFEDNTFEYILADNVLEHLVDCRKVIHELHRICQPGAIIMIRVPYWNAKCAYNDIGHKHYFNERAFELLVGVGHSYQHDTSNRLRIVELELVPSNMCRILPRFLRETLSVYLCNVIRAIKVKLEVVKNEAAGANDLAGKHANPVKPVRERR